MIEDESISARHDALCAVLNERDRRLYAASEAKAAGRGGIAAVSRVTGVARSTIGRGLKDLASPERLPAGRVRRVGGGRKSLTESDPTLLSDLEALVEPDSRGDPMIAFALDLQEPARARLAIGRTRARGQPHGGGRVAESQGVQLARQPQDQGRLRSPRPGRPVRRHQPGDEGGAGRTAPGDLLRYEEEGVGRRLQERGPRVAARGRLRGGARPRFPDQGAGARGPLRRLRPRRQRGPRAKSRGVGVDNDTAAFAVQTIRRWWNEVGLATYPEAKRLVVTADGGGSNGSRVRLWKLELQRLADELGIAIEVHHFPPGTSKWNNPRT
jgi:DNA-binding phage protein